MRTVFLVHPDELETAKRLEKVLLGLPKDSGILFVSVSVLPDSLSVEPRKILYKIVVGCTRSIDPELVRFVTKTYLRKEVLDESTLTIEIYRGSGRCEEFI